MNSLLGSNAADTVSAYTDLNALQKIKSAGDSDEALKKVAKEFESILVNTMLKSMRAANKAFEEDSLFGSHESRMYRDMYDQQLSLTVADGKGLGIAEVLYRQLKGQYSSDVSREDKPLASDWRRSSNAHTASQPSHHSSNHSSNHSPPDVSPMADQQKKTASAVDGGEPLFTSAKDFIQKLSPYAKEVASKIGLEPNVMIAQAALETGWGKFVLKSEEGKSSNNLFNIKSGSNWQGDKVSVKTLEYRDGQAVQERASFRQYDSIKESFNDFVEFLQSNPRYHGALQLASDAKNFIQALQDAGYATDPNYAKKVVAVFEKISRGDVAD